MKIPGLDFGSQRPSESSLKDIVAESDQRLGQSSTLTYTPDTTGEVNMEDLKRGTALDSEQAPNDGFPPRPVLGGTKSPW
jgi:hypothetical protein